MIIEFEINGARVIVSGDNLSVNVTQENEPPRSIPKPRSGDLSLPTPSQIKALRKSLGESQASFAKRLGVTQASVCRWERGSDTPNGAATIILSTLLDKAAQAAEAGAA